MVPDKSAHDLEWSRVEAAVLARCVGPRADEHGLPLTTSVEAARTALAETAEALALLEAGEPLPLDGIRAVRPHLRRLEREGALDGPALRDVMTSLGAARRLGRFLASRRERTPALERACPIDPTLDSVSDALRDALEPDGTVSDRASVDLAKLRGEVSQLRARMVRRLEEMVVQKAAILSDRFYTIREGRYVLPVRTDAHEKLPGIVHGTSASGSTVFVEPRALIEQGNRLKMAEGEMEREVARILAALSDRVRDRLVEVEVAVDSLDHADLRAACARFGRDLGGIVPALLDEPMMDLVEGRHPVLALGALEGDGAVVPNDISVSAGRGLVLSGPNAGGKTVALKVLGLTALMVRAGVPILVGESSRVGYFDLVLTDVGDDQSLARNLSTFSAHVSNLASILDAASRGSLVLLDEVATGTDPEEGAALACAVVDVLCRRGAAVAVTTHYEALKALALRDERLRNASVGFDVDRLAPTFELAMDVPGASSALLVAGRFGIPDEVIAIARRVLPEQSRTFDELVRQLEAQRQALSIAEAGLDAERRGLEAERGRLEQARTEQWLRERRQVSEETDRLLARIRTTRERVQGVQKALRERRIEEDQLREVRRALDQAASEASRIADDVSPEVRAEAPDARRPAVSDLTTGRSVWVDRLRTRGTVVEPPERGKVRVATGAVKLVVGLDELRLLDTEPPPAPTVASAGPSAGRAAKAPAAALVHVRTSDNTLDVRGLRVDEAVSMVESFVDRLYGRSEPVAFIVHGLGTGALREAIRAHFVSGTLYPVTARPGSRDEGGDGVTVVELA